MFLAFYTYSRPDKNADAGKICKTMIRPIMVDSREYAKRIIREKHAERGESIEGEIIENGVIKKDGIELVESFP